MNYDREFLTGTVGVALSSSNNAAVASEGSGSYLYALTSGLLPVTKEQPEFDLCWHLLPLVLVLAAVSYRLAGQYP